MKQKLLKSMLLLCALVGGISSAWGEETEDITFSATSGNGTNVSWSTGDNSASTKPAYNSNSSELRLYPKCYITISSSTKNIASVAFTYSANTGGKNASKATPTGVSVNTGTITSFYTASGSDASNQTNQSATWTASNDETSSFTITVNGDKGNYGFVSATVILVGEGGGGASTPSISVSNVNIAYNATNGSIGYTLNNATGNVTAEVTDGDWLTLGAVTASEVPFTCSANTGAERTAQVTLSFTGADDKIVTVTQAAKTVDAPVINLASNGNYLVGTGLTLTSAGNAIYYNMTTDGSDPADPTTNSTLYTGPIAISSGTLKIKSVAYDAYGNKSGFASRTAYGITPATLPFNWIGGARSTFLDLAGVVGYSLGDYANNDSNRPYLIQYDKTGDFIEIFMNEQPIKVSLGVKMIGGGNTSKITVQESTNGIEFSDVEELAISGKQNDIIDLATSEAFASTTRVIKLLFTKGSNVGVGPITINLEKTTLNASGYATFAANVPLDFSDDSEFSAWQITGVNGTAITFSQITGTVAANTGVLLKGTASATISIPVAASGTDISATNKLTGITTATAIEAGTYYGLKDNKFVKVNAGTVPAGKALLPVSAVGAGVKEFTFIFDDKETGIRTIEKVSAEEAAQIFDLSGRRLSKMQKGINIVNGKKILF